MRVRHFLFPLSSITTLVTLALAAPPENPAATKPANRNDIAAMQSQSFRVTADELDRFMKADSAANAKEPLSYPKGNGLRILMTGHSWVAPGRISLPKIAEAAGFTGHHQRSHTSGGFTGSALAIFMSEVGRFRNEPAKPILLPAIATGQWDVMTWGAFYGDQPDIYQQWMDLALKYNPNMVFFLQDGWPTYEADHATPQETLDAIDLRAADFQVMFTGLYKTLNAKHPGKFHMIPAGDAVVRILHLYYTKQLPAGFDCVTENRGEGKHGIYRDGGHLSNALTYLVGYCYYATLYKKSPELIEHLDNPTTTPEIDKVLRHAAWQAVIRSPLSGVTDKNENGIADEIE